MPSRKAGECRDPGVRESGQGELVTFDHAEVQGIRKQRSAQRVLALIGDETAEVGLEVPDPHSQLLADVGALIMMEVMQPAAADSIVQDLLPRRVQNARHSGSQLLGSGRMPAAEIAQQGLLVGQQLAQPARCCRSAQLPLGLAGRVTFLNRQPSAY